MLVIDNEEAHAEVVAEGLDRVGCRCRVATSGTAGARLLEETAFDVVITDLVMNDIDGLEILGRAKREQPDTERDPHYRPRHGPLGGGGHAAGGVQLPAQAAGPGPAPGDHAARPRKARGCGGPTSSCKRRLDEKFGFEGVVGESPQMRDVIERLKRIAPTNASVLIQGETGTGKELVAQAIHQNSPRKNKPFVALNCAALSENILESELFGHVKGAFTDASTDRVGKFEYAHGGTLFLDEVGDMPLATQIKLLRVLESGEITRVGSNDPIQVNVRILSATNRNLEDAIAAGTFRRDLYHRLKVITIRLPTLVERRQDMPMLIDHFIKLFSKSHDKQIRGVVAEARRKLLAYQWPGNVRQLRNVVESMVVVDVRRRCWTSTICPRSWPSRLPRPLRRPAPAWCALVGKPLAEIERLFIAETLRFTGGNREEAAAMLGIGERTLYRKIKEYGL